METEAQAPKKARVVGVIFPLTGRKLPPRPALPRPEFASYRDFPPQPLRVVGRPDKASERLVENGLALFSIKGHVAAIDYFAAKGIALRVISRVLWRPEQRRAVIKTGN